MTELGRQARALMSQQRHRIFFSYGAGARLVGWRAMGSLPAAWTAQGDAPLRVRCIGRDERRRRRSAPAATRDRIVLQDGLTSSFFPRPLRALEPSLAGVPLGGQYLVLGRRR